MHRIASLKMLALSVALALFALGSQSSSAPSDLRNLTLLESASSFATATAVSGLIRITDVSPDRQFGVAPGEGKQDPGGQVDAIAIDPNNSRIIYAATETAGVWKSSDAAHSWQWSSKGLRNGATITEGPALAVDGTSSGRLLYATKNDDFRRNNPYGGLYVSFDAAATWSHADLPNCSRPSIQAVAFSSGRAIVGTICGVFVSHDLSNWTNATPSTTTNSGFYVSASGPNIYACSNRQTWQSKELLSTSLTWTSGPQLTGACSGLTPTPDEPSNKALVLYIASGASSRMAVGIIDYGQRPARLVSLPVTLVFKPEGSGERVIVAARRPSNPPGQGPGRSYDLFIGRGDFFFQFRRGSLPLPNAPGELPAWIRIGNFHIDTHGFAVAPTYDPDRGRCVAYAATDGGVFATETCGTSPQALTNAPWVGAMHGLHAFGSYAVAGVSQQGCGSARPCPGLYLSSNDNGMWGTLSGGNPRITNAWRPMVGCCGDNGDALVDPGVPEQVATFRPGDPGVFRSTDARPPISGVNLRSDYPIDLTLSSLRRGITQILTPRGQTARSGGDYLSIQRSSTRDTIVRNIDPTPRTPRNWVNIAKDNPFPQGSLVAVQAANGHDRPTIYVLTFGPTITSSLKGVWKGVVGNSGSVPKESWKRMSNGLNNAINLFANPYDEKDLYVSDLGDQQIKSSKDGGQTWQSEPVLTQLATRNGEFLFDCGAIDNYVEHWYLGVSSIHRYACPLNAMFFVRDRPEIRIAVLHPGGIAFSRNAGANWIPLPVTELTDIPFGAFYDTEINPTTNTPSLYVALRGRGLIRVDAPFDTLAGLNFELRGLPDVYNHSVAAVDETTGIATTLSPGPDGVYRGTELFDSAVVSATTHVYHYVVGNQLRSSQFQRTINSDEISRGVANVIDNVAGEARLTTPNRR